jgi:methyl-accepting chemotaxis protein
MKINSLTIGRRVVLGFLILMILAISLGGFAVLKMHTATAGAEVLAEAVAPQTEIAANMAAISAKLQLAARTYGLTGSAEELAIVRAKLDEFGVALNTARRLGANHPMLTVLRDSVATAEKARTNYASQFEATVESLESLKKIREQLDVTAGVFLESINAYIRQQDQKLAEEIAAGLPALQLEERRAKSQKANEIIDAINVIRVATFKAQALRQPELIGSITGHFDTIETLRQELLAKTVQDTNLKQLGTIGEATAAYKEGIEAILKNSEESLRIDAARREAAVEFDSVVNALLHRSADRTRDYAEISAADLGAASRFEILGLIMMTVIGLVVAVIIIRGVNRVLTRTAESLSQGALQVAAASGQVSSSSQSLAEGASEQAASLEEISSSVEELASMTKRNADSAQSGKVSSGQARAAAETGASEMEQMQTAMNAIQQSSNDISKIIKTIDEIAFQTNILALNAAVEAARAGEAGAGFAVVADEVRSLAQRSAVAAKETADKIDDATKRSAQGVEISSRVATGLQQILAKAREVDQLVGEIATASHEQSEGISQINMAISQMDKVTQSNAASAEETASAAEELNAQSEELRATSQELAALVGMKTGDAGVPSETKAEAVAHPAPTPKKVAA